MADDRESFDGWRNTVERDGEVVRRPHHPWSRTVMALLEHLAEQGFAWSPRPVGTGFDEDGRELLRHMDGVSPNPAPWSDEAVSRIGGMLAELHRASSSFVPSDHPEWCAWYGRDLGDTDLGFGHGDLGPWNIVALDGVPTGFIDWDTAGPLDPVWELAQVAWLNAQLHDDDIAARVGLGSAAHRAEHLRMLVDGYGLARHDRAGFVDKMVEFAIHSAHAEAVEHDVTPDTRLGVDENGYPFAWAIAWRTRSASWMLRNRTLLERALGAPA